MSNGEAQIPDVLVVGAGLAGLSAARTFVRAGRVPLVLEAADAAGGRVRTDFVEGFRIDRGFQVLLTAYPECREVLDYDALDLRSFRAGALVRAEGSLRRLQDPRREPLGALHAAFSPIGTLGDKLRLLRLVRRARRGDGPEATTEEAIEAAGLGPSIRRFLDPFLRGVFLDPHLTTSRRMMDFVLRMFAAGPAALPATGMQAIPEQMAAALPPGTLRFRSRAVRVDPGRVHLAGGEVLHAPEVVVAVEGPAAELLVPEIRAGGSRSVTCLSFAADEAPVRGPWLVLDGEDTGPVNNLCVPSEVSPAYAPAGQSLVSATVLEPDPDDESLERRVRAQLTEWFGPVVGTWRLLRIQRIPHALPRQERIGSRPVRLREGLSVAGDYLESGSIQGAMVAGRRAAEAVLASRSPVRAT